MPNASSRRRPSGRRRGRVRVEGGSECNIIRGLGHIKMAQSVAATGPLLPPGEGV
jgi:hypothetical protein